MTETETAALSLGGKNIPAVAVPVATVVTAAQRVPGDYVGHSRGNVLVAAGTQIELCGMR